MCYTPDMTFKIGTIISVPESQKGLSDDWFSVLSWIWLLLIALLWRVSAPGLSIIFLLKFVPNWSLNVSVIVLLPAKLKLMNPTLVQREFEAKEDVEQDLKQLSSASLNAMAGCLYRDYSKCPQSQSAEGYKGTCQTGNRDS